MPVSEQINRQDLLRGSGGAVRHEMSLGRYLRNNWILYVMMLPGLLNLLIFKYAPMFGIVVAFQKYSPKLGYFGSEWVGLKHFITFFNDPFCWRLIRNTFLLGIYNLIFSFPAPILMALMLNEVRYGRAKRIFQTISYMPHFLSMVVVVGLAKEMFSVTDGTVNMVREALGMEALNFFSMPSAFRSLYIGTGIWQGVGYSSIIYLAAIAGINTEMYESAVLDGANRWHQIWYITLPSILPTVAILFIMSVGGIVGNDMQKILLMYTPRIYETADVISTYVYRNGLENASGNMSYSSAVGLLSNVVALLFLLITNFVAKKAGDISLF